MATQSTAQRIFSFVTDELCAPEKYSVKLINYSKFISISL